eukprot:9485138-Pyramimonas_sp.AAC.1
MAPRSVKPVAMPTVLGIQSGPPFWTVGCASMRNGSQINSLIADMSPCRAFATSRMCVPGTAFFNRIADNVKSAFGI